MSDETADLSIFDDLTENEMLAVIAYLADNLGAVQDPEEVNLNFVKLVSYFQSNNSRIITNG